MWTTLEIIVPLAIVLIFITEFLLPILMGRRIFGSFRKNSNYKPGPEKTDMPLDEKIEIAKQKINDIKEVQQEVDQSFKAAAELKNKADNLLK